MWVDLPHVQETAAALRSEMLSAATAAQNHHPIFKTDSQGQFILTGKAEAPQKDTKALAIALMGIKQTLEDDLKTELLVSLTKKKEPTTAADVWERWARLDPFLASWLKSKELAKLLEFFAILTETEVHPSYTVLVRTGRTSCRNPNVQQIPKRSDVRHCFVARPGHFLLTIDYRFIELVTFAATALRRYGRSRMADVIKAGLDPHANTAALVLGVAPEEFITWKNDPTPHHGVPRCDLFKTARQQAKPVNFGVPGGLGVASLVTYARNQYGVEMTEEEAANLRQHLIDIYIELESWLAEDAHCILARSLRASVANVRAQLGELHLTCVRKILTGNPRRTDGKPYNPRFVERVWRNLMALNQNPDLEEPLRLRRTGEDLANRICMTGVATITGRIRGRVGYSQARNTPFQGLAADGAGLALYELIKAGFRVVAFVHDEVLIELADEGGYVSAARVRIAEAIMCAAMASVLGCDIPVSTEATLSERWDKAAKLIQEEERIIPWKG